jgi:hypothetical protein
MAKPKSKKLFEYLQNTGVLNGNNEEIALAKIEYRKQYLKNWKIAKSPLSREMRIRFSLREYKDIQVFVYDLKLKPTTYAKKLILKSIINKSILPNSEKLVSIYQKIGLAINQNLKDHSTIKLIEALILIEEELNDYINTNAK